MRWCINFPIFFILVLVFLAGIFPFAFLGISLPIAWYLLWSFDSRFMRYLWGGFLAGLLLDSYSVLPFGTHLIIFFLLALAVYFLKRFLLRPYLLGEFFSIIGGLLLGNAVLAIALFIAGGTAGLMGSQFLFRAFFVLVLVLAVALFFLWLRFRGRDIYGTGYAI